MKPSTSGGGWKAVRYTLRMANQAGWLPLWRAMRSRNACKTCALGMGGQMGGMVNEAGWMSGCWRDAGRRSLIVSVPMLVSEGQPTLAQGARGDYDRHFAALGRKLVEGPPAIVREDPEVQRAYLGNMITGDIA